MRILIVCTGNICRSPMAQGFFTRYGWDGFVESAGLNALVGEPADPLAIRCMEEKGIDLSTHRARQLVPSLLHATELVLTASRRQAEAVEGMFPWTKGRVFRLGKWLGHDIEDPFRRREEVFRMVCGTIDAAVERWVPHLDAMRSQSHSIDLSSFS